MKMAGLQSFINDKANATLPPPSPGLTGRADRQTAQSMKFSYRRNGNSAGAAQVLSSVAPAPGYSPYNAGRDVGPDHPFVLQQENVAPIRDLFDEASVDSDFDATKDDIGIKFESFQGNRRHVGDDEYGYDDHEMEAFRPEELALHVNEGNSFYLQPQNSNQKHSKSPLLPPNIEQVTPKKQIAIVGRFDTTAKKSSGPQIAGLQIRPNHAGSVNGQANGHSKKHWRSGEPVSANQQHLQTQDPSGHEDEAPMHVWPSDHNGTPGRDEGNNENCFDISSDDTGSSADGGSPSHRRKSRSDWVQQHPSMHSGIQNDTRLDPDFDDNTLRQMTYAHLKGQSWEDVPHAPQLAVPEALQGRDVSLGERIEYYSMNGDHNVQLAFYASMSTSEWEQAGDFFLDKFADLLKKFKEARQAKRNMVAQFEAEIEAREKAVRGKSEILEKEFKEMKTSGESVLRGKLG